MTPSSPNALTVTSRKALPAERYRCAVPRSVTAPTCQVEQNRFPPAAGPFVRSYCRDLEISPHQPVDDGHRMGPQLEDHVQAILKHELAGIAHRQTGRWDNQRHRYMVQFADPAVPHQADQADQGRRIQRVVIHPGHAALPRGPIPEFPRRRCAICPRLVRAPWRGPSV